MSSTVRLFRSSSLTRSPVKASVVEALRQESGPPNRGNPVKVRLQPHLAVGGSAPGAHTFRATTSLGRILEACFERIKDEQNASKPEPESREKKCPSRNGSNGSDGSGGKRRADKEASSSR